jgi:sugar phosphate isomerase/epimerase
MRTNVPLLLAGAALSLLASCTSSDQNKEKISLDQPWKTGVALYSFNKFPFPQTLHKADSAGLAYVEGFSFHKLGPDFEDKTFLQLSDTEIEKLKQQISDQGLTMPSVYVGDAKTPEQWVHYYEMGKKLGLEFFVSEPRPDEWDLLDSLGRAYNIKTAIHQHAKGESYYWHPDSVVKAATGRPFIGACADVGHWTRSGLDPVECLRTLENNLISVHLKDVAKAGEVKAEYVVIGNGALDFAAIASELKRQNFKGYVYIEQEANWLHNVPDVMEGLNYFNSVSSGETPPEKEKKVSAHPPLEGIQHMVIFDLKHAKGSEEAKKFLEDGKRILSAIPSVQKFQAYDQVSPKNDFTYGFSMIFKDEAGYEAYNLHPDHVDFVENRWKPEVTRFLEIDFENFGDK